MIRSQAVMESLKFNECVYNMNPDAFESNGHESEGRRVLFSSSDNVVDLASPPSDAVKPTTTPVDCVASSRAEQGQANNSPPVGNLGSLGEALKFNLDVENCSPVRRDKVRDDTLTPSTINPTFAQTSTRRILSSRAEQGKENHSSPVGNNGDETVVPPGQDPKVNLEVKRNIAVALLGDRAGPLTPPNESHKSYKRQLDQAVHQIPEEVGKRNILRIERQCQMDQVVRQLPREFVKRDILRVERAFWMGEKARVLEQVDVEFFGPDWDDWDLRNEQAFWRGDTPARVLEQVDMEFFGSDCDDL